MFTFNPAFEAPTGSPIRELFKYLAQPGMISFAGGYPASDLFDREGLDAAAARASQQPALCLQYGPTDGLVVLKAQLAHLMTRRGTPCTPQELLVTTGSQQGFDLLLRVLVAPGDVVLVEQPAYPATLQALKLQEADVVTVPVDQDGLDVAALAALLEAGTEAGALARPPKLLYTVPTFANPTGATLSLERRVALLKLAARYHFLIVEDDPYGDLRFEGAALPSLLALSDQVPGSRDWVVHFSSLSKIVAPGLRVGWMVAHAEILRRCVVAKQTVDLCSSPWTQAIAAEYLASGGLERHLPRIVDAYAAKCRSLCDALDEHLGDAVAFHRPAGGMFVWAQLKGGQNASDTLRACIERNVMFVPGVAFYKDNIDLSALRLSFAAPGVAEIETGVQRMKQALALV
ncbi:2-aminoadipate aminotransferase [Paraburkholderia caffeinilytica]|uniref:Aminotransferase n=1 Tax=Paraburkholderia caffeinilytica TaxID=1761016 RepID=A0ABQ1MQD0_9BURK|nr:PLP-dependent aminotransferase family protein [Paraburkholderia caffeinilytica]AXL50407.1 2-aminoadipate aminotransferase [Paraburkholderia caffeinilytica]GGC42815.1 aminotransferase [Paraburkholderia caffeinilytica]CAB3790758.1 2-aminoadipate transaminase [Paraburkholderia caffeinilytica]